MRYFILDRVPQVFYLRYRPRRRVSMATNVQFHFQSQLVTTPECLRALDYLNLPYIGTLNP